MARDAFDLDSYLRRIGLPASAVSKVDAPIPNDAALDTLTALHEAHGAAIPFENLDILLGRPIRLDLASLQQKLVDGERGGYCFEHNTLFQAVLESLGLRVTPLSARVRVGATGIRPRTHMLLRVDLPQGPYLADVGFGGGGLVRPLRFEIGAEVRTGPFAHRLASEAGLWVLQGEAGAGWIDQYAFTLEPQYPIDFEVANHYTSTHPQSAFVLNLTAQRSWPDRRSVLRNRELVVTTRTGDTTTPIRDPEHLLAVLADEFGLVFPPGTSFSRPEF